jgi:hypothetical protein
MENTNFRHGMAWPLNHRVNGKSFKITRLAVVKYPKSVRRNSRVITSEYSRQMVLFRSHC